MKIMGTMGTIRTYIIYIVIDIDYYDMIGSHRVPTVPI
jgi:hypothetical protein